jgi:glycosyltransferase involved in cell wall biosynthesis
VRYAMVGEMGEPLVSIVTPCLNAARFIEQTIESVLAQDYPLVEYIVRDGGSTDGTVEILKKYDNRLSWSSGKDGGAADAIHRGFEGSRGTILAFLNADDVYLPGAIRAAVDALEEDPEAGGVYGRGWWVDESGARIAEYPVRDFDPELLREECFICQPASFVRRDAYEAVQGLDAAFDVTFDYEFWIRFARRYRLKRMDAALAESRMHRDNKSLGRREDVLRETFRVLSTHYGYVPFRWIYAYECFRRDRRDQFFEPLAPSVPAYLRSLPHGLWLNRRRPARYLGEWARVMTLGGLRRRITQA